MAGPDHPAGSKQRQSTQATTRDPHRISVPYVPPNPYNIIPPGASDKEVIPERMSPRRDSQYIPYSPDTVNPIEQDPNQLPQVVIEDAPEAVALEGAEGSSTTPIVDRAQKEGPTPGQLSGNRFSQINTGSISEASGRNNGGPDDHDDNISERENKGGCIGWWNRRSRWPKVIICSILAVLVIAGVATGVSLAVAKAGQEYVDGSDSAGMAGGNSHSPSSPTETESELTSDSSSSPTDDGPSSPSQASSGTGTDEPPTPTSTPKPAGDTSKCKSDETWMNQLGFVATKDTKKIAEWLYAPVSSAEDCCMACYANSVTMDGGCIAWNWNPYTDAKQYRCTNYQINGAADGDDDTCPAGIETMVFNDEADDIPKSVGDVGPCGVED
ncbi:hypothetical protein MKZ38_004727 [Zalerion maritima]|uniref:Uncharacterized protein n=1 Tax=Zalerion maritima TaxID=339359 RepID=A0AAD5RWB7_9PEZI|nr:hypothetical protein MKZ38_004727 [Zalerion maritima]